MTKQAVSKLKLSPFTRLALLTVAVILACTLFLTWNVKASWAFTLEFRGQKLISMVLVGIFIAIATLLFQTISQNKILTPSIMGFDALYMLIQSVLIVVIGASGYSILNEYTKWAIEISIMTSMMLLLSKFLFRGSAQSIQLLILSGVVLGICLSSINGLVFRTMDPSQSVVAQDAFFASFSSPSIALVQLSYLLLAATFVYLFRYHHQLDVLLLGEQTAHSLGINYARLTQHLLILIAILVGMSTALVGPITFLGLLVVHLAYQLAGSYKHKILLPFAALLGVLVLVLGEFILQHLVSFNTRLSIVIECVGGLVFLALVIKQAKS
ncbi:iron chelate uptake ABC transporter family permease subunit [Paraglaciecola sp. 2405UD69-4]|uniref:iron chelate uptake ABC transporter family permease subunit n=1 Tax=Paraglaciecola sp. 2405UD69-4 TaxID=3391836 RepID=UPI0039C9A7B8